ncbi:MAG: 50S ribosomal protein L32 [Candidatus Eisenbacteria sp.]|nr:50S ribosomal protein L32 [Candidatus Eisenbacteria bacterium]
MALPKRRHSKARRSKRRATWRASTPMARVLCPHCGQAKRPHRICPHCGHYRGEEVLLVKEA